MQDALIKAFVPFIAMEARHSLYQFDALEQPYDLENSQDLDYTKNPFAAALWHILV